MESIKEILGTYWAPLLIVFLLLAFIGIIAQWALYEKANQPGWACIVPVYNVVIFLRIVGRPAQHLFLFLIPIYNIYFIIKVYVELCNAFGRHAIGDYILCIIFNGFYIFHLGLSPNIEYKGAVYKKTAKPSSDVKNQKGISPST